MFNLFKMPKRRTFGQFLTSSEDKLFFIKKEDMQARRQDSVTGGGRNKFLGGTRSLFEYGSNEKGERQKKGLCIKA